MEDTLKITAGRLKNLLSLTLLLIFLVATGEHFRLSAKQGNEWQKDVEAMLQEFLSCKEPVDDKSPCNVFLARALHRVYGIKDFGDPSNTNKILNANAIATLVAGEKDWTRLGTAADQTALNSAQEYANRGKAVIAVWKHPSGGHGHVALIIPGALTPSGKWGLKVPNSASFPLGAPQNAYIGEPLSKAFAAEKKKEVILYGRNF